MSQQEKDLKKFIEALFIIVKTQNEPKYPEKISAQIVIYSFIAIVLSDKKKQTADTYNNTDESYK